MTNSPLGSAVGGRVRAVRRRDARPVPARRGCATSHGKETVESCKVTRHGTTTAPVAVKSYCLGSVGKSGAQLQFSANRRSDAMCGERRF